MNKIPTILAIESAIHGGSIALARGRNIVDTWIGEGGVSRAEELLWNIDNLLKRNRIDKSELTQLAVSAGPGSFTGIRIGLATTMGIAASLGIPIAKYSALQAMAAAIQENEQVVAALPVGRGVVCIQTFRTDNDSIYAVTEPVAISIENFDNEAKGRRFITIDGFTNGLATCLIDAVNDIRVPIAAEPLFISKPAHL